MKSTFRYIGVVGGAVALLCFAPSLSAQNEARANSGSPGYSRDGADSFEIGANGDLFAGVDLSRRRENIERKGCVRRERRKRISREGERKCCSGSEFCRDREWDDVWIGHGSDL